MIKLSQRDPRWKNIKLGTSNVTIGGYGCLITCLAMLAGTTPDIVNQKLNALPKWNDGSTGYARGNLVIWGRVSQALPNLKFIKRVNYYNNEDVRANVPCIVEVDFDGTPRTDDRHFVIFIGNRKLYDPWTGTERPTSDYVKFEDSLKGYAIYKKI